MTDGVVRGLHQNQLLARVFGKFTAFTFIQKNLIGIEKQFFPLPYLTDLS
jgi:uncharacterized membrane protein YuzA (DUF378 family)